MRTGQPAASPKETGFLTRSELLSCLLLFIIVIGAALLRFYRLDAQSFWNDEGNSARIAERSVDLILEGAAGDVHPPGYYLLLHAWRGLFGSSEFALRALSVVAGLALVVFTYLLGRELFWSRAGLVAAALSAVSPLSVYYSQEARMYALLGTLSAASTYLAFRAWGRLASTTQDQGSHPRFPILALYALVNAAGLYTHYAFVFVVVAHNVVFGLRWILRVGRLQLRWGSLAAWLAAQLGVCLLFVPWLQAALNAAGWSSAGGTYRLGRALVDVMRVLVVGVTQSIGESGLAIGVAGALMGVGLSPRVRGRREADGASLDWWSPASLAVYVAVPLVLFFALDLYKPAWLKFLMVLLPPFHVLVARGIGNAADLISGGGTSLEVQRPIARAVLSGLGVVGLSVLVHPSLQNLYFDPSYARDDYRQVATDIRDLRRPGDAILLNAPNQWEVFTYYYPDRDVYPAPYRPSPGKASRFLGPLLDEYERLFVLYWGDAESDPHRRIESWLADHAYKAGDQWYGDVRLSIYGVASLPQELDVTVDALFGDRILLRGYSLVEDDLWPGEIIPVTLFWEAQDDIEEPYKVSVQLLDRRGRLLSQVDTVPGDGLAPTTSWRRGSELVDRYGVCVDEEAASGEYELQVVVYHASHGERLPVRKGGLSTGNSLALTEIKIESGGE